MHTQETIVNGIRSIATGMIYVGCSFVPQDLFYQHLISGESSNLALQETIPKYRFHKFMAILFTEVQFPAGLPHKEQSDIC